MEEKLPPACAFAVSVLAEYNQDPDAVPEEAIEAAQEHVATCPRCKETFHPPTIATTPRKKKRSRKAASSNNGSHSTSQTPSSPSGTADQKGVQQTPVASQKQSVVTTRDDGSSSGAGPLSCLQCRELFPEYVEAMDSGQKVALLYPELQEHLS